MAFSYDNATKTFTFNWKECRWDYRRSKVTYIPAERNLVEWLTDLTKEEKPSNLFIATHSPYILETFLEKKNIGVQLFYTRKDGDQMLIKTATEQDLQDMYDYGLDAFFNMESLG